MAIKYLTHEQLDSASNTVAQHLQELGAKPELFVALAIERSLEAVVGLLGILKFTADASNIQRQH